MSMTYDVHIPLPEKYGKANTRLYIDLFKGESYVRKAIDLRLNENQMNLLKKGPSPFMKVYGHVFSKNWDTCSLAGYDNI